VDWDDEQFDHSEKFLLLQVKALIARNVWETQQYYQVMASADPGVQKALEVLGSDKEYKRILKGK
jgi:carboxyl-terminal processing protease